MEKIDSIIKDYLALKLKTTRGVELENWQEIAKRLEVAKPLEIGLSQEDLEDLQEGKDFNWEFEGIEVHLYNEEAEG